jgi:hypothetical protein
MSIFRSRELSEQDQALNAYANSLRSLEERQNEEEEGINAFNSKLRAVTTPIGGALVTQPLQKVVRAGVNKALGFTEQKIREKLSDVMAKASNGDLSSFGRNLPSNIQRNIRDVLSDEVSPEVKNAFGSLSKKAQDAINLARRRAGKNVIRNTEPPSRASTGEPTRTSMDNPSAGNPDPTQPADLSAQERATESELPREPTQAQASEIPADPAVQPEIDLDEVSARTTGLGDQLDALRDELNQNLADTVQNNQHIDSFRDADGNLPDPENFPVSVSEAIDRNQANVARANEIREEISNIEPEYMNGLQQMARTPATDRVTEQIGDSGNNAPAQESGESAGATDQPSADNGDSGDAIGNNLSNTEVSDEALTGLEDTAETLDALSAGTSEIPVLGEIIAGIAGVASIIAGAEGAKSPAKYGSPITSGIQFGV